MLSDRRQKEGNLDNLEAPSQSPLVKEGNSNDELQEARKGLTNVLKDTCSDSKLNGNVHAKSIVEFDPPMKPHQNKYAFAAASMTSIMLDYDIGVMSEVAAHITKDKRMTDVQVEVIIGILNVFSLLKLMMAEQTSDWIGCRYTIMVAGAIFFSRPLIMGFALDNAFLLLGHFAAHDGISYSLVITSIYIVEVFIIVGTILGYISNYAFSKLHRNLGWHVMLSMRAISLVLFAIKALVMPKSPRWLIIEGFAWGTVNHVHAKTSVFTEES